MHTQGRKCVLVGALVVDTDVHACMDVWRAYVRRGCAFKCSQDPGASPRLHIFSTVSVVTESSLETSASVQYHRCYASGRSVNECSNKNNYTSEILQVLAVLPLFSASFC